MSEAAGRRAAGAQLHRAVDPARDQSYFLFATRRDQLDFLRFPLGGLPKPVVRQVAGELGLAVADKPDSQDICFVPEGRYTTASTRCARKARPGGRDRACRTAACSAATKASAAIRSASGAA